MSVKKWALLGLASVAALGMSLSAVAAPATPAKGSGFYVGLDVGASFDNTLQADAHWLNVNDWYMWSDQTLLFDSSYVINRSEGNVPWQWTASALMGYAFNDSLALQFGYIWDQKQRMSYETEVWWHSGTFPNGWTTKHPVRLSYTFKTYSFYLALRGTMDLTDKLSIYAMVGPSWTRIDTTTSYVYLDNSAASLNAYWVQKWSVWSPMGALGLSYKLPDGFDVSLQYMFITQDLAANNLTDLKGEWEGIQRLTVGVNYTF